MSAPEFDLLLASARTLPDSHLIQQLVQREIDWRAVWALATRYNVRPLVCRSIKMSCWNEVPEQSRQEWQEAIQIIAGRNLFLAGELISIVRTLETSEIQVYVLKGLLYGQILYGDITLRETSDFDLLVRQEDLRRTAGVLQGLGYLPRSGVKIDQLPELLRYVGEYTFVGGEKLVDIDLHWRFSNEPLALAPDFGDFRLGIQSFSLAGSAVQSIAIEELPLYLTAQGGNDFWNDLRRVCDVAEYLRRYPDTDWSPIVAAARRHRAERILFTGLQLAASFLGSNLPEGLAKEIERKPATRKLAAKAADLMRRQRATSVLERHVFQIEAKDGFGAKARLFWSILTDRMTADVQWIPLPRSLWGLYGLLRPLRMMMKLGNAE